MKYIFVTSEYLPDKRNGPTSNTWGGRADFFKVSGSTKCFLENGQIIYLKKNSILGQGQSM